MLSSDLNGVIVDATTLATQSKNNSTKTAARQFVDRATKLKLRLMAEEHAASMMAMTPVKGSD